MFHPPRTAVVGNYPVATPVVWCGVVRACGCLPSPCGVLLGLRCGVVRGMRPLWGVGVIIIIILFLSWVHPHRNRACQERDPPDNCIVKPSCRSRGWEVFTVARMGCVWDEILVTFGGFGAPMSEKCMQSQGFGMFGRGRAGRRGEGCGGGRRTENRDHVAGSGVGQRRQIFHASNQQLAVEFEIRVISGPSVSTISRAQGYRCSLSEWRPREPRRVFAIHVGS